MVSHFPITDAVWSEIEAALRELKHDDGSPSVLGDRMFIEAVLYQTHAATP